MSTGYGWNDLETALIAMVPGIERTSHGNMLLASLSKNREAMIATLRGQFGDDVDAVLDGIESIVDAELEIRAGLKIHDGIGGKPERPQRMARGLRDAFFVDPPEEDERDAEEGEEDIHDERVLGLVGADLPPEESINPDGNFCVEVDGREQ